MINGRICYKGNFIEISRFVFKAFNRPLSKVVEEPYSMRDARIHLRHVRDLLKSLDPFDAYNMD